MADISKITVEGVTYDIKDSVARSHPVTSVNGQTGAVVLDANDVNALPDTYVAPVTSVNGMTGDVVVGGGSSYTATAPIDITSDVISHDNSGVTADTYTATSEGKGSWDIPSITVDAKGHITSATKFGATIPNALNDSTGNGGLISGTQFTNIANACDMSLRFAEVTLTAGQTSTTYNITPSINPVRWSFQGVYVLGVFSFDKTTFESVKVDYSLSARPDFQQTSQTVTISIASAYAHDIVNFIIFRNAYSM